MIVGFNTDVKHRGRRYHVQTEDKGLDNPLIETHVYITGGQIIDTHHTKYGELLGEDVDEARIVQLMENQHRRVISLVKSDHYLSPEERAAAEQEEEEKMRVIGAATENERSFDELVVDWLAEDGAEEEVELIMRTDGPLVAGQEALLSLKASKSISRGMVADARLTIRFISTGGEDELVFEGETDRMGECEARFRLPPLDGGNAAVIIRCESDFGTAELRQLVQRAA